MICSWFWPLEGNKTNAVITVRSFPSASRQISSQTRLTDFNFPQKKLFRNGVNKKLLWTEQLKEYRLSNDGSLTYSQFCHRIQQRNRDDVPGLSPVYILNTLAVCYISLCPITEKPPLSTTFNLYLSFKEPDSSTAIRFWNRATGNHRADDTKEVIHRSTVSECLMFILFRMPCNFLHQHQIIESRSFQGEP